GFGDFRQGRRRLHHRGGDAEVARVLALGLRPLVQPVAALRIVAGEQGALAGDQRAEPLQAQQRLRVARGFAFARPGRVVDVLEVLAPDRVLEALCQWLERGRAVVPARRGVDEQDRAGGGAIAHAAVERAGLEPVAETALGRLLVLRRGAQQRGRRRWRGLLLLPGGFGRLDRFGQGPG